MLSRRDMKQVNMKYLNRYAERIERRYDKMFVLFSISHPWVNKKQYAHDQNTR